MSIIIDNETLNKIKEIVFETTSLEEAKQVEGNFKILQYQAREFLQTLSNIKIQFSNNSPSTKINKQDDWSTIYADAKEMLRNKIKDTNVKAATIKFEEALNDFLGRKIILTLVTDDGEIIFYNTTSQLKIYEESGQNKKRLNLKWQKDINGNYTGDALITDLVDQRMNQIFDDEYRNYFHYLKKKLYTTIMERYQEVNTAAEEVANDKIKMKESEKNQSSNKTNKKRRIASPFIYWHDAFNNRIYAYVKNKGVIAEGYTLAVFASLDERRKFIMDIEPHDIPHFYDNYITAGDNRSGTVLGDIANEILSPTQLAVKNERSSSQTFGNLATTAYHIVQTSDMTKENLAEWFEEQEKQKSKKEFSNNPLIKNLKRHLKTEVVEKLQQDDYHYILYYHG